MLYSVEKIVKDPLEIEFGDIEKPSEEVTEASNEEVVEHRTGDNIVGVSEKDIEDLDPVFARVIERYSRTVKPMYLQFIEPSKRYADIIFPEGGRNLVAIDVITAMVEKSLREKQQ